MGIVGQGQVQAGAALVDLAHVGLDPPGAGLHLRKMVAPETFRGLGDLGFQGGLVEPSIKNSAATAMPDPSRMAK